jgi:hypothetical protein
VEKEGRGGMVSSRRRGGYCQKSGRNYVSILELFILVRYVKHARKIITYIIDATDPPIPRHVNDDMGSTVF